MVKGGVYSLSYFVFFLSEMTIYHKLGEEKFINNSPRPKTEDDEVVKRNNNGPGTV